jgi:cytochrome c biogenesis protein CcmG, thiol:disulfide interchange protein DsbE
VIRRGTCAVAAVLLAIAVGGCASSTADDGPAAPTTAASTLTECPEQSAEPAQGAVVLPTLAFDCPGGGSLDLGRAPGRPTVLNLWGSWCPPCREELPIIQEFADAAAGQVAVMGVISKDGLPQAESFAEDAGITFPNAFDGEGELMAGLGINQLPFTYFLDADGALVHTQVGPFESADELRGLVAEHLGVQL